MGKKSTIAPEELNMQDSARKITFGAMMLALFAILLAVSTYTVVGFVTTFFIPLPIMLYRLRADRTASIVLAMAGLLLSLLIAGIATLPFALLFLIIGLLVGELISQGKTKLYTFMATSLTLLILGMLAYLAGVFLFQINLVDRVLAILASWQKTLLDLGPQTGTMSRNYKELVHELFAYYRVTIPMVFIGTIFFFSFFLITFNFLVMRRIGVDVPQFPPLRELRLPVITVFIYGLLLLYSFLGKMDESSGMYVLYINATLLLRFLFLLQGLSLIHYFMHKLKTPGILTVLLMFVGIVLSPITILLGLFDAAANVRLWIDKDQTR
ncbi:YybS family protein [Sporosarcina sp. Te-1]|uniref:YybS family protein n=1 Tax=Sporosarcina sp. Te-1 TaxID=2818390 RepID=UPI001A9EC20F|nr:DUF2232 domain-containing protein [Sporosarcina sp. Te-1]QTD40156.1 DUF2232 domain-containing protein [Sporosarcina sp. Te-1]